MDNIKRVGMIAEKPHPRTGRTVRAQHPSPLPKALEPGLPMVVLRLLDAGQSCGYDFISPLDHTHQ